MDPEGWLMVQTKRLNTVFVVMVVLFLAPWAALAAEKGTMEKSMMWPSEAGGWKRSDSGAHYEGRTIFKYMDGAGEVYLAYNFRQLTVSHFEKQGHPSIIAELYEMGSPADAFGVFSFDRQDPEAGIGQGSEFGGGLLRFWKGRYFVSIYGEGEGKEQEQAVIEIGQRLAAAIADTGEPPRLIHSLPQERQVEGSVRFLRSHVLLNQRYFISYQNILQLGVDTEAVFAQYDLNKSKAYLLLIGYPDEAKAKFALVTFRKAYMKSAAAGIVRLADGTWTGAEIDGPHIVIALHAPNPETARRLIAETKPRLEEER
jgi:hypothetical protein